MRSLINEKLTVPIMSYYKYLICHIILIVYACLPIYVSTYICVYLYLCLPIYVSTYTSAMSLESTLLRKWIVLCCAIYFLSDVFISEVCIHLQTSLHFISMWIAENTSRYTYTSLAKFCCIYILCVCGIVHTFVYRWKETIWNQISVLYRRVESTPLYSYAIQVECDYDFLKIKFAIGQSPILVCGNIAHIADAGLVVCSNIIYGHVSGNSYCCAKCRSYTLHIIAIKLCQ